MIFNSTFGSSGVGFLFLTFGYYAASLFTRERSKMLVWIAGIVSVVTCALNGKVDLGPWIFGSVPLYVISALAGTFFIIEISKFISSRLLTFYGRNTLIILGTHQVINLPIRVFMGVDAYSVPVGILVFVGIMLIEIPIAYLFNRFLPFFVGKKNSEWKIPLFK